jgi:hypothetical protein
VKENGGYGLVSAGAILLIGGALLGTYWALFMSWSHSSNAPSFQQREFWVQLLAAAGILGGGGMTVSGLRKLVPRARDGDGETLE